MELRPYQQEAIDAWGDFVNRGGKRGLMVLPTASGKTVVFAHLPRIYGKTLVLAHREELLDQAAAKLQAANPTLSVGIEAAERTADGADLVVGSVPTLGRARSKRLEKFDPDEFGLVVVDEAHHASPDNTTYARVLDYFSDVPRLGVTATPQRGDKKGLVGVFDEVIFFRSIEDMIKEGWLVPPVGYRVKTGDDISDVHTRAGEFVESELAEAIDNPGRNQLAVDAYLELAIGRRACVYCVNIAHAEHMEEAFRAAGLSVASVFGHTDKQLRRQYLSDFAAGKISIMVSVGVLTEGWDDPGVACLILARPTKSTLLYTQIIGRGLRLHEAKDDCIIIDLVDACAGKKPVGLPTLMGLPSELDTQGKPLHEVAERFRELEALSPEEASQVKDTEDLEKAFERIDLFRVPPPDPFVMEMSKFIWMETGPEHWVLNLAGENREKLSIQADALGRYEVAFQAGAKRQVLGAFNDVVKAFAKTDHWVKQYRGDRSALVERDAVWRHDPPTDKQLQWLRKYKVPITEGLTKGQASLILDRLFGNTPKRQVPAWVKYRKNNQM
jgi:ATP-dependent helicase IRC3